jgi:hypothetical protein
MMEIDIPIAALPPFHLFNCSPAHLLYSAGPAGRIGATGVSSNRL